MANPPMVLVADDREEIQELLTEVFGRSGFAVAIARNGIEAVGAAFRLRPELIILDFDLPWRNGCDAARILKTDRRTRLTPIILLSGHTNKHFIELARQAGCDRVVQKPFAAWQLVSEAKDLLLSIERAQPHAARTLLIVDDDREVRQAMAQLLEEAGYETAEASNGAEALQYLQASHAPDLILLDLMMPEMNGWDFRRVQLRDPVLSRIPVAVMSGVRERVDELRPALSLGKPPKIDELFRYLERGKPHRTVS